MKSAQSQSLLSSEMELSCMHETQLPPGSDSPTTDLAIEAGSGWSSGGDSKITLKVGLFLSRPGGFQQPI